MANKLMLKIGIDDKGNPALKKLMASLDKTATKANKTGTVLKKVFASVTMVQGLYLMKRALVSVGNELLKYETSMKQIKAISKSTTDEMKKYNDMMLKVSNTTEHTALATAKAGVALSKMGFDTQESLRIIPLVSDLATASLTETEVAMETLGTTMKAFGLDSTYAGHMVDVFQETINSSPQVLEDYKMAMSVVAPVAKTMGVSLLETSSMIKTLAEAGLKGTIAGNTLKNTFLNIMTPSKQIKKVLKDNNYEFKNFVDVLNKLEKAGIPLPEILDTFNKRAITGVALMMKNADATQQFTDKLENAKGVVKDTAEVIRGSLENQLKELWNAFVNTANVMYQAMHGSDVKLEIYNLTESLIELQAWVKKHPEAFLEFADAVKQLTNIMGQLASFISNVFIKNFDMVLKATLFFTSAKMLGAIANWKLLDIQLGKIGYTKAPVVSKALFLDATALKTVSTTTKGATTSVATFGTMLNTVFPYLLVLEGGLMAINKAFEMYNRHVDDASNATNSMELKAIENRLDALVEYKLELQKVTRAQKENEAYRDKLRSGSDADRRKLATAKFFNEEKARDKVLKQIASKYHIERKYLEMIGDLDKKLADEQLNLLAEKAKAYEKINRLKQKGLNLPQSEKNTGGGFNKAGWNKTFNKQLPDLKPQLSKMNKVEQMSSPEVAQHMEMPLVPKFNPFTDSAFRQSIEDYKKSVADTYKSNEEAIQKYEEKMTQVYYIIDNNIDKESTKLKLLKSIHENQIQDVTKYREEIQVLNKELNNLKSPVGKSRANGSVIKKTDKEAQDYASYYKYLVALKQKAMDNLADVSQVEKANATVIQNSEKMLQAWKDTSEKTLTEMENNIKTFHDNVSNMQKADLEEVDQATKQRNASLQAYFEEQAQGTYDAVNMTIDLLQGVYDQQWDKMQARHKKEMSLIDIRKKHSIAQAKDSIYKQEILSRYWENSQNKLRERQEKEDREMRKRQKAMDIVSAVVNTAVGVTASLKVGMPLGAILAAATAVAGATQIALISSQNYRDGGYVQGQGTGRSDSIPTNLSRGEYVLPEPVVNNIGVDNLDALIDGRVDSVGNQGGDVHLHIDTLIGEEEYVRDMAVSVSQELQRIY